LSLKKIVYYIIGIVCIVIGAAGVVLPIVPGWPFLFLGLTLVAPRQAIRLRNWVHRRFFKQETIHLREWRPLDVHAGFTTKHFPLMLKKTDDLLDLSNQDKFRTLIWKSHVILAHEKSSAGKFAFLNQVHGDAVVVLEDAKLYDKPGFYHFLKADAVVTNIERLTLVVMSADCLSVFLCAPKRSESGRKTAAWVGVVHAGWRGTRLGIVKKAVATLSERSGIPPSEILASFGPAIGNSHYEVGQEFLDYFPPSSLKKKREKLYFDLPRENRRQLLEAGLRPGNLLNPKICTIAENRHFYSFRKEKADAGRIISFITIV